MSTIKLSLKPEHITTLRNMLNHVRGIYQDERKKPPAWVNKAVPDFIETLEKQDKAFSIQGNMDEADYEINFEHSKALSFLTYHWLGWMQEHRREYDPYQINGIIRDVFKVADILVTAHRDLAYNNFKLGDEHGSADVD